MKVIDPDTGVPIGMFFPVRRDSRHARKKQSRLTGGQATLPIIRRVGA